MTETRAEVIRLGTHDLNPSELVTKLLRYAKRLTRGDLHRAEDLVNDTVVQLLAKRHAAIEHPWAYAYQTLYHQFLRSVERERLVVPREPEAQVFEKMSTEDVHWHLTTLDFQPLLDRLSTREKTVFFLLFDFAAGDFKAMDQQQAAERLGISRTAVSSALHSLRTNLQSMLRESGVEEND